jgi:hydroxyacylglutathione hydrolase
MLHRASLTSSSSVRTLVRTLRGTTHTARNDVVVVARRRRRRTTRMASSSSPTTPMVEIVQIPALEDNYVFLLRCGRTGSTAVVDTPEVTPIRRELESRKWTLTHVLNTHWHADHTGGNVELKKAFPDVHIIGPRKEKAKTPGVEKIPGIDRKVDDGDSVFVGDVELKVMDVPGHTLGHCAYHVPSAKSAFVGDCVFAAGCGRVFEGTHEQMFASITKIMSLPETTKLYCAHEYTLANIKFAKSVDGQNKDLLEREKRCKALRERNEATVPTTVGEEMRTNPFCRSGDEKIRKFLGMEEKRDVEVFARLRTMKDNF